MKKNKKIKSNKVNRHKIDENLNASNMIDKLSDLSEEEAITLGLNIHHQTKNNVWEEWKKFNFK